jgi:hypothetical protein
LPEDEQLELYPIPLYSLIECAKINDLEPYAYLRYVFTELPKAGTGTIEATEALLPGDLKKDRI